MKKFEGNLKIEKGDKNNYLELEEVTGDLLIYSQTKLDAPNLKSVGGYLLIYSQAKLDALKSVGGDLSINSQAKLDAPNLKSVGGYLSINSQAKLDALKSVGGDLYLNSPISLNLSKRLWEQNQEDKKKIWKVSNLVPEWLIKKISTINNSEFYIRDIKFSFDLFEKVRKDKLTPEEIFEIENLEQRRVAYGLMDKTKMKQLKDYKVLDEVKDDGYGNLMEVVEFSVKKFDEPLRYLRCFCATTKREYFVETRQEKCWVAKNKSFGLEEVEWVKEW